MKKILFLFWTHWDEAKLVKVMDLINSQYLKYVDWEVVNKEAFKQNKRFIKFDINRIAPWDLNCSDYEIKRAAEIIQLAQNYEIVLDIHWTLSDFDSFILLSKATIQKLLISSLLSINKIVLWQSNVWKERWPLKQFIPHCIEVEIWRMDKAETVRYLVDILNNFLDSFVNNKFSYLDITKSLEIKKYYDVVYKISKSNKKFKNIKFKDFEPIQIGTDNFYPILTDNPYGDIRCYLMQKVDFDDLVLCNFKYRNIQLSTQIL